MKTIQHTISLPCSYPLERLCAFPSSPPAPSVSAAPAKGLLFFDIETTGFSGDRSALYLIGCILPDLKTDSWHMVQWFADTSAPETEKEMLTAFFTYLKEQRRAAGHLTLVHFNGDMFDIPFLLKRCRYHGLSFDFSGIESLDIYRKIRPYKSLLGLDSLKQKAIERFLKLDRTDRYSGGQLIEVYHTYLRTKDPASYDLLILHNAEDLKGMPQILPILSYPDMLEHGLTLRSQQVLPPDSTSAAGSATCPTPAAPIGPFLELVYQSPYSIPVPFQSPGRLPGSSIRGEEDHITCRIPLYEGELRYFYPNYKDYYYLPFEDMAVHKSVGEYVAKEARVKATAKTCYTRKSGLFLPQPSLLWQPAFHKAYKDKISYVPYEGALFSQPQAAGHYLRQLLP